MRLLWGVVMVLAGLGMIGWVPYVVHMNRATESWVVTQGTLTRAEVEEVVTKVKDDDGRRRREKDWYAAIAYSYVVDGERYSSTTVSYGGEAPSSSDRRAVELYVESFRARQPLEVLYDPAQPSRSCLERATLSWPRLIGLVLLGILAVIAGIRIARGQQPV